MSDLFQGGARRRHWDAPVVIALAVLVLGAAGGALWLAFGHQSAGGPPNAPVAASRATLPAQDGVRAGVEGRQPDIRLSGVDRVHVRFAQPPRAGLLFDLRTGKVLWRRRPLSRMPIASLTKIMTAVIVAERTRAGERVRVPKVAIRFPGSGIGVLKRGKRVPVEALLYALMLPSGNDAAVTLATGVAGSEHRFVRMMNARAQRQGLSCTHYVSSHGLQKGNVSCAADLASLARLAMSEPRIASIVRHAHAAVRFPIKGGRLFVTTHNPLLLQGYKGTIGLKTGYTVPAGHCLVAVVRRNGRTLAAVLLDSPDTATQARQLFDTAFRLTGPRPRRPGGVAQQSRARAGVAGRARSSAGRRRASSSRPSRPSSRRARVRRTR
jgi:serine-type D-Ala-D-Ala carboxypeptidase (penicillin-binding protein 5/6)